MPYVLIPDGHKLEKATKLQVDAVSSKRRHDDVVALLANPNTPLVIGGMITAFFAVNVAEGIIEDLEETVGPIAEATKSTIRETIDIRLSRPEMIREAIAKGLGLIPTFTEFKEGVTP